MSRSLRQIAKEANALSSLWNNRDRYAPPSKELEAFTKDRDWNAPKPRIRLDVPYTDKDKAKALGARWDATEKAWYCYTLVDGLKRWIPDTGELTMLPALDRTSKKTGKRPFMSKPKATPKNGFVLFDPLIDSPRR
ncbi:DUF5710 domain-containing protein [Paraburkholderia sediminicola]|uniref:DUF5710 domain-containing protein n=1 Tax=Paraburkholderia sediminicola TaxID=458836 RepID=UPI0038BA9F56